MLDESSGIGRIYPEDMGLGIDADEPISIFNGYLRFPGNFCQYMLRIIHGRNVTQRLQVHEEKHDIESGVALRFGR
jgi:hypothetical protein